jgi:putative solute:sodium symporter small subunit
MLDQQPTPRQQRLDAYWKANCRLIGGLLAVWFAVAYLPPLLIDDLSRIEIAGFPLGYYMGSQGALIIFVLLICYYVWRVRRLDRQYGLAGRQGEDSER